MNLNVHGQILGEHKSIGLWAEWQMLVRADGDLSVLYPIPRSFARKLPVTSARLENFAQKSPENRKLVGNFDQKSPEK